MEFGKIGYRVDVGESIRVEPFGKLLQHHEMVRRVVELVPDGVMATVLHSLQLAPARPLAPELLQPFPGVIRCSEITQADKVAVGTVREPVGTGADDDVRVSDDDLLRG